MTSSSDQLGDADLRWLMQLLEEHLPIRVRVEFLEVGLAPKLRDEERSAASPAGLSNLSPSSCCYQS